MPGGCAVPAPNLCAPGLYVCHVEINERVLERFNRKVVQDKDSDCWLWTGSAGTKSGHGRFADGDRRFWVVHRFAYTLTYGPIPDGYEIDRVCRVKLCVNPTHLEAVTPEELRRRTWTRIYGERTHCVHGHEWTPETTFVTPGGTPVCRICCRDRARQYRQEARANQPPQPPRPPRTHCRKRGHELTADNVYVYQGSRLCRVCQLIAVRKYQARLKLGSLT